MIYWFTGQPGAGKTTLALAVQAALRAQGAVVVHLEGEFLRELMGNRDFSPEGRNRNVEAGQRLAAMLSAEGVHVAASFVSPDRRVREELKRRAPVLEIYVHTTEVRGRERFFAQGYEPPLENFVDMDTTGVSIGDCVARILAAAGRTPS